MLDLNIIYNYIYIQWNLYNPDTSGTSLKHVLIIEVSIGSFIWVGPIIQDYTGVRILECPE